MAPLCTWEDAGLKSEHWTASGAPSIRISLATEKNDSASLIGKMLTEPESLQTWCLEVIPFGVHRSLSGGPWCAVQVCSIGCWV
jgi:hypothetical protein